MPSSKRIEKLTKLILKRAGEVVSHELKDPRLGLVTITRVDLTADLRYAKIYWSVLGDESERSKSTYALEHARGHIQSEIAHVLHTRVTPILSFHYDESIEGVILQLAEQFQPSQALPRALLEPTRIIHDSKRGQI